MNYCMYLYILYVYVSKLYISPSLSPLYTCACTPSHTDMYILLFVFLFPPVFLSLSMIAFFFLIHFSLLSFSSFKFIYLSMCASIYLSICPHSSKCKCIPVYLIVNDTFLLDSGQVSLRPRCLSEDEMRLVFATSSSRDSRGSQPHVRVWASLEMRLNCLLIHLFPSFSSVSGSCVSEQPHPARPSLLFLPPAERSSPLPRLSNSRLRPSPSSPFSPSPLPFSPLSPSP